jgi:hypothetical protein
MPPHAAKVLLPCLIFSTFKGDNCQKSLDPQFQPNKVREWKLKISYFFVISRGTTLSKSMDHNQIQTWPAHSYDVSTHTISTLSMHQNKSLRGKTKNFFKRNKYVKKKKKKKNHHTKTKCELDRRNSMMYPYIKFELNVCNHCWNYERKLKISIFFKVQERQLCQKSTDHNQI